MTGQELLGFFDAGRRSVHVVGSVEDGVVAGLELEGRLFAVWQGEVLNRVVPEAILGRCSKEAFLNPGGDALWPAPEGTCLGYEYAAGDWRVPPTITGACYRVVECGEDYALIRAEIDLVNNRQLGIPCEFDRRIRVTVSADELVQEVEETTRYIGTRVLERGEFLLAPWSLCQFDCGPGSSVAMPGVAMSDLRDLYDSSEGQRDLVGDEYVVRTETVERFQVAMGAAVPWIEFRTPDGFRVRREASLPPSGQAFCDIADAPPDQAPSEEGVRYSVYCDPSGFMEIEACGGCPQRLEPGDELSVTVRNTFREVR